MDEEPILMHGWDYTGWKYNSYKQKEWNQTLMTFIIKMKESLIEHEKEREWEKDVSIPNKPVLLDVDENLFHLFETLDNFHPHLNPNRLGGDFLIRFYSSDDEPKLKEHKILFGDLKRGVIEVQNYKPIGGFDFDV